MSAPKGMHQRPAGLRRAVRIPRTASRARRRWHAEPLRDRAGGELTGREQVRGTDPVGVAKVARGGAVERFPGAGAMSGGVQCGGQFGVGQPGPGLARERDRGRVGAPRFGDPAQPGHDEFVGGAGVPAHADPQLVNRVTGDQGDVGHECPQQTFAVPVAVLSAVNKRGRRRPTSRVFACPVGVSGRDARRPGPLRLRRVRPGGPPSAVPDCGPPDGSRARRREAPFGPVGSVAGPVHAQFRRARLGAAIGHLPGRGQGQSDFAGWPQPAPRQSPRHQRWRRGPNGSTGWPGGQRGTGRIRSRAACLVAGAHRPPAATTKHDALAQSRSLPGRTGAGIGPVGGQSRLVDIKLLPGDVAGMVIEDTHRPLGPR